MTATRVPALRQATRDDAPAVVDLLDRQLRELGIDADPAATAHVVAELLAQPRRGQFVVAEHDGALVGVAALCFATTIEYGGASVWLEELFVLPAWRGSGLGARLLAEAERVAAAAGAKIMDLEIELAHPRAASLYARAGFRAMRREHWWKALPPPAPAPAWPATAAGSCFCGAVRFALDAAPTLVSYCHCTMCRRTAGAPVVAWATYPRAALRWTASAPRELQSSPTAVRTFCPTCGTPLTFVATASPDEVDVTVGSLDTPDAFPPADHIWTDERIAWFDTHDDLRRIRRGH